MLLSSNTLEVFEEFEPFIYASLTSSTVPAVNKWLDAAFYQLCKLVLAHMLLLNENQGVGLKLFHKHRFFPIPIRYSWKFVFEGSFEYVILQAIAQTPMFMS